MSLPRQFATFFVAGLVATAVHMLVLVLLVEAAGTSALAGTCAGALAGALTSYALNRRYTFRSARPHAEALPRFLVVAAGAFVLNGVLMAAILAAADVHYLVAQVATTAVVLVYTFSANRAWSFR